MLLVHTVGQVKVGEIVRYTVTYTPSQDRILPIPTDLYLRIKNTAALPLRAAYLHGPYIVYVSVRRQEFHPYEPWFEQEDVVNEDGIEVPMYDPHLKAGASFYATLRVPQRLREEATAAVAREGAEGAKGGRRSYEKGGRRSLDGTRNFALDARDQTAAEGGASQEKPKSVTWIIEIISQTIFSTSATVGFEVLLGRDEKSLAYGYPFGPGNYPNIPGADGSVNSAPTADTEANGTGGAGGKCKSTGVLSGSIMVKVQDIQDLWNLPPFPSWSEKESESSFPKGGSSKKNVDPTGADNLDKQETERKKDEERRRKKRKTKKVHLVILTHGLHSNTGADMLFMKEAIDEEGRKMETELNKQRREKAQAKAGSEAAPTDPNAGSDDEEDDREMLIVRGYQDNKCRTERGIKYLGTRLAKYVVSLVNPQKPNPKPLQQAAPQPNKLRKANHHHPHLTPAAREHSQRQIQQRPKTPEQPPYKVTSISFIGHSLGGLVQTYAIAWIQAHHPKLFQEAKPVNFVALATPFLGLSNENPIYVKFALGFGLVGRTGQDLGLAWRAPNMAASLSSAFTSSSGEHRGGGTNGGKADTSKPLLRILPTGPAHEVFKMFRNRTVYANVVNDGIVPLRTSCLLFLDWKGLGRVEKARKENFRTTAGQVVDLVGWGWGQLTTSNSSAGPRTSVYPGVANRSKSPSGAKERRDENEVPVENEIPPLTLPAQIDGSTILEAPLTDDMTQREAIERSIQENIANSPRSPNSEESAPSPPSSQQNALPNAFSSFLTLFRPHAGKKQQKVLKRSQTLRSPISSSEISSPTTSGVGSPAMSRPTSPPMSPFGAMRGMSSIISSYDDFDDPLFSPPRTTILEAAGDVLNPPLPPVDFIVDPSSRPRTIFHDRVYHSDEIPPAPARPTRSVLGLKRRESSANTSLSQQQAITTNLTVVPNGPAAPRFRQDTDTSGYSVSTTDSNGKSSGVEVAPMRVEEKIARAYHKDLSWRKVLVKLEPDAHNNMIVRRMFANAHGWPVVRHVVDTHFGVGSKAAQMPDSEEGREERAGEHGEVVGGLQEGTGDIEDAKQSTEEKEEEEEDYGTIRVVTRESRSMTDSTGSSGLWSDTAFEVTDDDTDAEQDYLSDGEITPKPMFGLGVLGKRESPTGTTTEEINEFLSVQHTPQRVGLATPTSVLSKIDVFGTPSTSTSVRGSLDHGDSARRGLEEQLGSGERPKTIETMSRRSSAVRELSRVKSASSAVSTRSQESGCGDGAGGPAHAVTGESEGTP